jgi:hypothetical protein
MGLRKHFYQWWRSPLSSLNRQTPMILFTIISLWIGNLRRSRQTVLALVLGFACSHLLCFYFIINIKREYLFCSLKLSNTKIYAFLPKTEMTIFIFSTLIENLVIFVIHQPGRNQIWGLDFWCTVWWKQVFTTPNICTLLSSRRILMISNESLISNLSSEGFQS